MPMYEVTLERRLNGAAFGSTRDTVEHDSPQEAEDSLIAQWRELDPRYTYTALLTVQVQPCRGCGRTFRWSAEADYCPDCAAANAG
jgi:hypothetical protein